MLKVGRTFMVETVMHRDPIIPLIAARKQCEAMLASSKSSWRKRVAAAFTRGRLERRLLRRRPITNEGALASLELILLTLKSYPDKDQGLQLISSLAVGVHSQFQRDASRTPKLAHNRRRKGSCPRAVQPKGGQKQSVRSEARQRPVPLKVERAGTYQISFEFTSCWS